MGSPFFFSFFFSPSSFLLSSFSPTEKMFDLVCGELLSRWSFSFLDASFFFWWPFLLSLLHEIPFLPLVQSVNCSAVIVISHHSDLRRTMCPSLWHFCPLIIYKKCFVLFNKYCANKCKINKSHGAFENGWACEINIHYVLLCSS